MSWRRTSTFDTGAAMPGQYDVSQAVAHDFPEPLSVNRYPRDGMARGSPSVTVIFMRCPLYSPGGRTNLLSADFRASEGDVQESPSDGVIVCG